QKFWRDDRFVASSASNSDGETSLDSHSRPPASPARRIRGLLRLAAPLRPAPFGLASRGGGSVGFFPDPGRPDLGSDRAAGGRGSHTAHRPGARSSRSSPRGTGAGSGRRLGDRRPDRPARPDDAPDL